MSDATLEQLLEAELAEGSLAIGEIAIVRSVDGRFQLMHRGALITGDFAGKEAGEIARFDSSGNFRPLKAAPSLRADWRLFVSTVREVIEVVEAIYPARLPAWRAWRSDRLATTSLRETLNRQSGMYRVAAKISDEQINDLVANFCRSDGRCLRTILWRRDQAGTIASNKLPPEKFDPAFDQNGRAGRCVPLLCQEACNLLVSACREVVKRAG